MIITNMKGFKVGDKVRITGDCDDFTDHLDGKIGEVVIADERDIEVKVEGEPFTWRIWNHNAELIEAAPVADVAPVIHARWEVECRNRSKCSNCGLGRNTETQIGWNYCPNCGAKMDGGAENGT